MRRLVLAAILLTGVATAAEPKARPAPSRADEPRAATASLERGAAYLDAVATEWTQSRQCGSCHTNAPYLMARPWLGLKTSAEEQKIRTFFEERVRHWDRGQKGDRPRWPAEVVVTAAALAGHDARTSGKLHSLTRQALDRMWQVQRKDGGWTWLKCNWPPMEHDDDYGAVLAAVAVSLAPDGYAQSDAARAGLEKLRGYLRANPPPSLHHKAWLLWASVRLEGMMSAAEQAQTVKELLARQRPDGGWNLTSLGDWKGYDGRVNDTDAPSDGYGTGLAVFVLRQAGLKADHAAIQRGADWLRKNQRVSGRWFTRSLNHDRAHYVTNLGTAFALLALKVCE